MRLLLFSVALLLASPLAAQEAAEVCEVDLAADPLAQSATDEPASSGTPTEAERRVQEIVAGDGVHVVHFWAPWCRNSIAELRATWMNFVERHPDVTFTFVTIWNDGVSGRDKLDHFAVPGDVVELTQPDFGPSGDEAQRRRMFLGLPVTWVPSTWIFHNNGELAFALNYGEMSAETLDTLLAAARRRW